MQEVEEEIRAIYPEAAFIELEPDSKDSETRAIVNMGTKSYRLREQEAMTRALADLARTLERKKVSDAALRQSLIEVAGKKKSL